MRLVIAILLSLVFAGSAAAQISCPTLSVTGPSGYIAHGMAAIFSINPDLPNFDKLKYEWTATAGTIDRGQGTPHLYLITNNLDGRKELKVSVRVIGRPEGCSDTAELVHGEIQRVGDPVSLDEWGRLSPKDELARLDVAATEWLERPTYTLFFIVYLAQNETASSERTRMKRIVDHLTKTRKIPKEHVVIIRGGKAPGRSTVIWLLPPGADPPQP